jgi:uncharacterized glyoxalase superfamily protein PhnB
MCRRSALSRCAQRLFSLAVDSSEEAERVFKLLNEGGEVFMPMEETFFAFRFGVLRDRFGTSWMILHQNPMPGVDRKINGLMAGKRHLARVYALGR